MAEVLVELMKSVVDDQTGEAYGALAVGEPMPDGTWQGWLEFVSTSGGRLRSPRETTQPNREDTIYWATGLTPVYLEGAFQRARTLARGMEAPRGPSVAPVASTSRHRSSSTSEASDAREFAFPTRTEAVLDPFSVHQKGGEALLRRQLSALSSWHLVNIVVAFGLSERHEAVLSALPAADLIDIIVEGSAAHG